MTDGQKLHGSIWTARLCLALGVIAVGTGLIGAIGAGQDWWGKLAGVQAVGIAFLIALIGLVFGLPVLANHRRKGQRIFLATVLGLVLSGAYVGVIGYYIVIASSLPQIHDITTDLANPPQFTVLELREDNLAEIPGRGDAEFAGMDAMERWRVLHAKAYGDIKTVRLNKPVPIVIGMAEKLARQRGWEVVVADPEIGRFEATDTVSIFKFKDDVVLRVQPGPAGLSSVVDMRSVSRVGVSDLGENAKRIRAFLADLKAEAGE